MSDNSQTVAIRTALDSPTLSEPLAPVFVGHNAEVERARVILEKRQPYFAVVTGEAGSGKTSFLRLVSALALAGGWNVAPKDANEVFAVNKETSESSFCARIRELIAIPSGASFIETKSTRFDLHPIVRQLRERAPVLLVIDGYKSSAEFAGWFNDQFIKGIKQSNSPIVIALAERPDAIAEVSPVADEILPLGKLDKESIKRHFKSIGQLLIPPIEGHELDEYVTAVSETPELLGSLSRVLRLASVTRM